MTKTSKNQHQHHNDSVKETIESIVIAFILAFIFRAYVVEAFIIPTGSMAPTLLGQHLEITCSQCGYTFPVDSSKGAYEPYPPAIICPMCRFPNPYNGLPLRNGDRILVQKYAYLFNQPKRWDVVVFKTPIAFNPDGSPGPTNNYIKRLVGLPNESIRILDGNIYTLSLDPQSGDPLAQEFMIARKSTNQKAQEAVLRPIYHSQYIPLDLGKSAKRTFVSSGSRYSFPWKTPWVPTSSSLTPTSLTPSTDLNLDNALPQTNPSLWSIDNKRSYTYSGDTPSAIAFDFTRGFEHTQSSMYPYNELKDTSALEPIEDIRLSVVVNPQKTNTDITLSTTARWNSPDPQAPPFILAASLSEGNALLTATNPQTGETQTLDVIPYPSLLPNTNTELQLRYIDQQLSLWIDGSQILSDSYDLPLDFLAERRAADPTPRIKIITSGPTTFHDINLDRDLYYAPRPTNGLLGHGAMARTQSSRNQTPSGPVTRIEPFDIGPDEFFCMGDNSPSSSDSRVWSDVDPWVDFNYFHNTRKAGVVPGELMLGQAFFVYFPAPYGFVPNFGQMRFIH
ncbi:signal peptidase I [Planctomycetota bacterium]|nr:signal peptidase I [Planctomycetota bacterium]